jgi:hypothetical protein
MIIGILLGISIAISLTSITIITLGATNLIKENLITGAIINPKIIQTNSIGILISSLVLILLFTLILKKRIRRFKDG